MPADSRFEGSGSVPVDQEGVGGLGEGEPVEERVDLGEGVVDVHPLV